ARSLALLIRCSCVRSCGRIVYSTKKVYNERVASVHDMKRALTHMVMERLDVRLDPEHRRKLKAIAAARGISVSEVIRDMIDRAFEQTRQAERLRAAQHLVELSIDDVPEPDVLKKHLAATHDLPDLY